MRRILVVLAVVLLALLVVLIGPVLGQADGGSDPIIGGTMSIDTLESRGPGTANTAAADDTTGIGGLQQRD